MTHLRRDLGDLTFDALGNLWVTLPFANRVVAITPRAEPGPSGLDDVAFEIATNPGAPFGDLGAIASGGELARFAQVVGRGEHAPRDHLVAIVRVEGRAPRAVRIRLPLPRRVAGQSPCAPAGSSGSPPPAGSRARRRQTAAARVD